MADDKALTAQLLSAPRVELERERIRARRALTPKERAWLDEYYRSGRRAYAAAKAVKIGHATAHAYLRKPRVQRAMAACDALYMDDPGISPAALLEDLARIRDRCMQAEPVTDREGNPTGEYQFDARGALKAVEMLGRHRRMWGEDKPPPPAPAGPGLTVVIQQGASGEVNAPQQIGVVVNLPEPQE